MDSWESKADSRSLAVDRQYSIAGGRWPKDKRRLSMGGELIASKSADGKSFLLSGLVDE